MTQLILHKDERAPAPGTGDITLRQQPLGVCVRVNSPNDIMKQVPPHVQHFVPLKAYTTSFEHTAQCTGTQLQVRRKGIKMEGGGAFTSYNGQGSNIVLMVGDLMNTGSKVVRTDTVSAYVNLSRTPDPEGLAI